MKTINTTLFEILLVSAWSIKSIGGALSLLALWQLKEYRFDRIRAHLSTKQGQRSIFNYRNLIKWLLLFSFPLYLFFEKYRLFFPFFVTAVFLLEVFVLFWQKLSREFKRPKFTQKIKIILALTISTQGFLLVIAYLQKDLINISTYNFLAMLCVTLDRGVSLVVAFYVSLLAPLSTLTKRWIVRKAKSKIKSFPHLKVVGITGSYGKSSTKEILAHLLSLRFKVLKTVGSENTDIGVAKTILSRLNEKHEIFIVEMGAYKLGEIKSICDIVYPQVGLITAIGEQHLKLFKTKENILNTKMELIESLPEDGLAVLNGDSERLRNNSSKLRIKKLFFGTKGTELDIFAKDIVVAKRKLRFNVVRDSGVEEFKVPLLGRQNIPNILAVTLVAQEFDFTLSDIAKAMRKIKPSKKTMEPVKGLHGTTFINDTFNVSPKGLEAALRYIGETQWRSKTLVLQPLIELGEAAERVHMRVGTLSASICDKVYFTNDNYKKSILAGFTQSKKNAKFFWFKDRKQIASQIHDELEKHDVVLFEGKETERVLNYLKEHKYK